jgi:hypothetical protein
MLNPIPALFSKLLPVLDVKDFSNSGTMDEVRKLIIGFVEGL